MKVGDAPVSGPAGRLMEASGLPVTAAGVARAYAPWLDCLVLDDRDRGRRADVEALGVTPVVTPTLMTSPAAEVALARAVLDVLA